jgi:hypothetical protein
MDIVKAQDKLAGQDGSLGESLIMLENKTVCCRGRNERCGHREYARPLICLALDG